MKILLVSYMFPPNNAIGAVRIGKLAKFLTERGHDVRVLAGHDPVLPDHLPLEIAEDHVVRARSLAINTLPLTLLGRKGERFQKGETRLNPLLVKLGKVWRTLFNIPDGQIGWLPFAVRAGRKLIQDWRPDVIYASAMPFTSFLVAERLSRRHKIPWVAEFRDLWTDSHYYDHPGWRKWLESRLERSTVQSACGIVTVSEPLAERLRTRFDPPIAVVMNGFDLKDYDYDEGTAPREPAFNPANLNILYMGLIYLDRRDPTVLFKAIGELGDAAKDVRVYFYGRSLPAIKVLARSHGVERNVVIHEAVPYRESLRLQQQADVLLLLLWDHPEEHGVLTGKLFEYIGARRPILAIGLEDGLAPGLIHARKLGVASSDPARIKEHLNAWLKEKRLNGRVPSTDPAAGAGLSRSGQFQVLERFLVRKALPNAWRILYLSLEAPREGQASYAHVNEIINGLERRHWKVTLFAPSYSGRFQQPGILARLVEYAALQRRLMRAVRRTDVIYVRSHFLAFPIALWAKMRGIPVIQEVNGPYEDLFITYRWTRAFAWLLRTIQRVQLVWADRIITVTPSLKTWLEGQIGPRDIRVVPNGANTDLFNPEAEADRPLPKPYVLFFGGLARWQGLETLLEAVETEDWPKGVHLVIVGDGQQRDLVEKAAARLDHVCYLGRVGYTEVPGIVRQALAGLVPKNSMGDRAATGLFPLKIFETLACGTPAVVTDFPGQADLVRDNDCGLVVPPEDPQALARAVAILAADPERAKEMGARGAALIKAEHSWDRRAADTQGIINQVSSRRVVEPAHHGA